MIILLAIRTSVCEYLLLQFIKENCKKFKAKEAANTISQVFEYPVHLSNFR